MRAVSPDPCLPKRMGPFELIFTATAIAPNNGERMRSAKRLPTTSIALFTKIGKRLVSSRSEDPDTVRRQSVRPCFPVRNPPEHVGSIGESDRRAHCQLGFSAFVTRAVRSISGAPALVLWMSLKMTPTMAFSRCHPMMSVSRTESVRAETTADAT